MAILAGRQNFPTGALRADDVPTLIPSQKQLLLVPIINLGWLKHRHNVNLLYLHRWPDS